MSSCVLGSNKLLNQTANHHYVIKKVEPENITKKSVNNTNK